MAERIINILTDDFDGSDADETVNFGVDGVGYTIDLSADNAAKFRASLQPYIAAARKPARSTTATRPSRASNKARLAAIRAWAGSQGIHVSDRGRIKQEIVDRYDAHNAAA